MTTKTDDGPMLEIVGDDAPPGALKAAEDAGTEKTEEEETEVPLKEIFGRLFSEVKGIKLIFVCGLLSGLVAGGSFAFWAYLFGKMMIILNQLDVRDRALEVLIYFVAMGAVFGISIFFQFNFFIRVAGKIGAYLRVKYLESLLFMDISFYDSESTGALAARLASETKLIELGLGNQFGQVFQNIGMFLGGFLIAFIQGWLFTLILLALTPVVAIGGGIAGKFISELSKDSKDMYSEASARSAEIMAGFETIMSLAAGKEEGDHFEHLIKKAEPIVKKKAARIGAAMALMNFINQGFFYGIGMYIGALLVHEYNTPGGQRGVSVGEVFAVFFAVFIAGMGMGQLGTTLPDVTSALVACSNLYKIIDRAPKVREPDGGKEGIEMKVEGSIKFENVSFAYPTRPDVQVLQNVTLEINTGETVAFVGPSGCGKSTMISLIERFYDPTDGRILIDGVPIWNLKMSSWRAQLGYVGQEPVLFDGTISENILLGTAKDEFSFEHVKKAAEQANAHMFIKGFPEGYGTMVGEGGGQMSGGQKQRVSIARALIRDPQILLLDEATSALDTESEKIVQEALDGILAQGNRTCIVIAHRLSTIMNADKIVVFKDGEIVQMGKYDELAQDSDGVFHTMLMAQDVLGADALKRRRVERVTQRLDETPL